MQGLRKVECVFRHEEFEPSWKYLCGNVWQVAGGKKKMEVRIRRTGTRAINLVVTHIEVMGEA